MNNLKQYLSSVPADRILMHYNGDVFQSRDLIDSVSDGILGNLAGKIITVCTKNPVLFVKCLLALDGSAKAIFLAPPSMEAKVLSELMTRCDSQALLTDRNDLTGQLENVPIFSSLMEMAKFFPEREVAITEQTAWLLSTSGTTGVPKLVSHTLESLTRTTKFDTGKGGKCRWGMLYDFTRFAGLQVLLQSLLGASEILVPAMDDDLKKKLDLFCKCGVTHLSATPTMWRKIIMSDLAKSIPLRQITLGGEIADNTVLRALSKTYPSARIAHIYASSEAGVGFSVIDGQEGFPIEFLETPPNGIALKIDDGHLYVKNRLVSPRYIGDSREFRDEEGFVDTGDIVEIQEGRVIFLGRSSGVINVGGDKVHPEEVERVLLQHPLVREVSVSAKKNPIVGALVMASVVLKDPVVDTDRAKKELLEHCMMRLDKHKVPALLKFKNDISVNVAGKMEREN